MATPHNYEDTMRRHDAALHDWLGELRVDYGDNRDLHELTPIDRNNVSVLRVFSTPDRVVAAVVDRLVHTGWIAGNDSLVQAENAAKLRTRAESNFAVLPLPLVSIVRNDPTPNPQDSGVPKVFRRKVFNQVTQTWEQHRWPGAYETTYQVTFWCLKRYTEVFFREWVHSRLGSIGVAESEVLIPVKHEDPWGTIEQRLVFEGSSDLSDLEGDGSRYIRSEYTFRLRTWLFRNVHATTSYVHDLAVSERDVAEGEVSDDLTGTSPASSPVSLNLFSIYLPPSRIPTHWPRAGAATVQLSSQQPRPGARGLRVTVTASTDEVLISNRAVPLDNQNRAVLSLAAAYRSTALARVQVSSRDPGVEPVVWIPNRRFNLPARAAWTGFQFFALIEQPIFSCTLQGAGSSAITYLADVSLVHVRTTRTPPDSSVPSGPNTVHTWTGLGGGAHLVVLAFGTGAVAGTILVGAQGYSIDPSQEVGLVALFTPVSGSVTVTVPNTIPVDAVYVQPFLGSWRGTEV